MPEASTSSLGPEAPVSGLQRLVQRLVAACLALMALAVVFNLVLRYGFGSGVADSE